MQPEYEAYPVAIFDIENIVAEIPDTITYNCDEYDVDEEADSREQSRKHAENERAE